MPEPVCGDCPDFIPTLRDGGVCDSCRAEQWFKGDRPACSRRLRELVAQAEVVRLHDVLRTVDKCNQHMAALAEVERLREENRALKADAAAHVLDVKARPEFAEIVKEAQRTGSTYGVVASMRSGEMAIKIEKLEAEVDRLRDILHTISMDALNAIHR